MRRTLLAVAVVLWAIVLAALLSGGKKKANSATSGSHPAQPANLVAQLRPDARFYLLYKCLTKHSSLGVAVDQGNYYGVISNSTGNAVAGIQYAGTSATAREYAQQTGNFTIANVTYYFPQGHDPSLGDYVITCLQQIYG